MRGSLEVFVICPTRSGSSHCRQRHEGRPRYFALMQSTICRTNYCGWLVKLERRVWAYYWTLFDASISFHYPCMLTCQSLKKKDALKIFQADGVQDAIQDCFPVGPRQVEFMWLKLSDSCHGVQWFSHVNSETRRTSRSQNLSQQLRRLAAWFSTAAWLQVHVAVRLVRCLQILSHYQALTKIWMEASNWATRWHGLASLISAQPVLNITLVQGELAEGMLGLTRNAHGVFHQGQNKNPKRSDLWPPFAKGSVKILYVYSCEIRNTIAGGGFCGSRTNHLWSSLCTVAFILLLFAFVLLILFELNCQYKNGSWLLSCLHKPDFGCATYN